jgi:hypothetical protein
MEQKCKVEGCENLAKYPKKRLCVTHYERMRDHGSYELKKTRRGLLIEKGMSYCPSCKQEKPLSEFNKDKNTYFRIAIYCRECQKTKNHQKYQDHRESHRNTQLRCDFGITLVEYKEMLAIQGGGCAICDGQSTNGRRLSVDHCHETGQIRGLLCDNCNFALGHLRNSIKLALAAAKYLERTELTNKKKSEENGTQFDCPM